MKIVFFGTPKFAAKSLEYLHNYGIDIASIVSSPDQVKGRGKKISSSSVTRKAKELNINVLTPLKLQDEDFINSLRSLDADLFIVVAFKFLPKTIWEIPKIGTINLHTSLLPSYRGAAPINRVLINGEKHTGITTFFINENIDSGQIILQKKVQISEETTAAQLHNMFIKEGSHLLIDTINKIQNNNISPKIQDHKLATKAPKIDKELRKINWKDSAINIHNLIRGLSPIINKKEMLKDVSICPGAWCILQVSKTKKIHTKILLSKFHKSTNNNLMSMETDNKSFLKINLLSGSIFIEKIQVAGKKAMNISDFLSGNKIDENWKII